MSVDCDCDSHPAEPEMEDIGIFASLDPVAIDQACYDAVMNSKDPGKKPWLKEWLLDMASELLKQRMSSD